MNYKSILAESQKRTKAISDLFKAYGSYLKAVGIAKANGVDDKLIERIKSEVDSKFGGSTGKSSAASIKQ